MNETALVIAGSVACLGMSAAGSAFGTGFAASAAVGAWKKCYAAGKPAPFILLGLVGVPVFSGFSGGVGKLMGPTGGYIIGYLFVSLIAGLFIDKFTSKLYMHACGMVLGTAVCYAFGTLWLAKTAHMAFKAALLAGVIPFIPADIVKIIIALLTGPALRKAINKMKN